MTANHVNRRRILKGAGALGAAGALAALPAAEISQANGGNVPSALGTWLETVTVTGNPVPPFQTLTTYAGGGGLISTASINLSPASLGTGAFGTWKSTGPRSFHWFGHAFAFTPQGVPNGILNIHESVTLNEIGDALSGSGGYELVKNGVVLFSFTTTVTGTRVTV